MDKILSTIKSFRAFLLIFASTLLFSFHCFFIYFINSSYISAYSGEKWVGAVYALGAALNIAVFFCVPALLRRMGNYCLALLLVAIEGVAVAGLAFASWPPLVFALFILSQTAIPIIFYTFDIFLERFSPAGELGEIRGIQLTMINLPPIITPFITGLILTKAGYSKVYLISALFLAPLIAILISYFRQFKDAPYPKVSVRDIIGKFYENKNVFDIYLDNFLLNLFYCWTVIYVPIYLYGYIGFSWVEIGTMLSIMLLPFIFIQIPLGQKEDRKHDEKEFLTIGFTIMAVATILTAFIHDANFVLWTALLLVSRIGASMVEVSGESYFFKHISPDNAGFLSLFRINRSLPYLIVPLLAGACLIFMPFQYMFVVLGSIMFLGIRYAFKLEK